MFRRERDGELKIFTHCAGRGVSVISYLNSLHDGPEGNCSRWLQRDSVMYEGGGLGTDTISLRNNLPNEDVGESASW